jgi:hypothetical protein
MSDMIVAKGFRRTMLDNILPVVVCRRWSRWSDALAIVRPATVIAWHRRGFSRFWAWKSRRVGRPPLAPELARLIERMSRENPLWSRRRMACELAKLRDEDLLRHDVPFSHSDVVAAGGSAQSMEQGGSVLRLVRPGWEWYRQ